MRRLDLSGDRHKRIRQTHSSAIESSILAGRPASARDDGSAPPLAPLGGSDDEVSAMLIPLATAYVGVDGAHTAGDRSRSSKSSDAGDDGTGLDSMPAEILDEISAHVSATLAYESRLHVNRTLCSLALVGKRYTAPAQQALVRHLVLAEPARVDELTKLFLKKKDLAKAVRSIELKIGPSDIPGDPNASSAGRRALELNLLGLLPLTKNVREVAVAASYDCPSSLIDLLSRTLTNVRSFSLASAFGYSKLVYVSTGSIFSLLSSFPSLEHFSMTMPWILDDGTRRRHPQVSSNLKSLEISGFRGEMADLEWLLGCCDEGLTRFAFDCPLDNEPWEQLAPTLGRLSKTLTDLSLWSWTYAMPVEAVLRSNPRLRYLSLAAHDCTDELFRLLPASLRSLLICSHREFSPLKADTVRRGLEASAHLRQLPRLTLYDPSAHGRRLDEVRSDPAWVGARARGTDLYVTPDPRVLGSHVFLPSSSSAKEESSRST